MVPSQQASTLASNQAADSNPSDLIIIQGMQL